MLYQTKSRPFPSTSVFKYVLAFVLWCSSPNQVWASSLLKFLSYTELDTHTHTHTHRVGLLCTSDQRFAETATYTTQQTQEMKIHVLSRIRTCDPIDREAPYLGLRPRSHRDRFPIHYSPVTVPLDTKQSEVLRASLNDLVRIRGATRRGELLHQVTNISNHPTAPIFRAE